MRNIAAFVGDVVAAYAFSSSDGKSLKHIDVMHTHGLMLAYNDLVKWVSLNQYHQGAFSLCKIRSGINPSSNNLLNRLELPMPWISGAAKFDSQFVRLIAFLEQQPLL